MSRARPLIFSPFFFKVSVRYSFSVPLFSIPFSFRPSHSSFFLFPFFRGLRGPAEKRTVPLHCHLTWPSCRWRCHGSPPVRLTTLLLIRWLRPVSSSRWKYQHVTDERSSTRAFCLFLLPPVVCSPRRPLYMMLYFTSIQIREC